MKQQIDTMSSSTGWSVSDASAITEVDWPHLRASHIRGQLQFSLAPNTKLSKDFVLAVDGDTIGFTICKARFLTGDKLNLRLISGSDTIDYVIDLVSGYKQYKFPNPYTSLTGVQILADAANEAGVDLIVTDLLCFTDEFPEDIALAVAAMINEYQPDMPLAGTIKAVAAGSNVLNVDGDTLAFLERSTVFTVATETHQVEAINRGIAGFEIVLGERFDGEVMLSDWPVGTELRPAIPIVTNPRHVEGITPAISIEDGFDPKKISEMSFREQELICRDTDGNIYIRHNMGMKLFEMHIHGLARSIETEALIRKIFGQIQSLNQPIWVNGAMLVADLEGQEEIKFDTETESVSLSCAVRAGDFSWQTTKILNNQSQTVQTPQPVSRVIL